MNSTDPMPAPLDELPAPIPEGAATSAPVEAPPEPVAAPSAPAEAPPPALDPNATPPAEPVVVPVNPHTPPAPEPPRAPAVPALPSQPVPTVPVAPQSQDLSRIAQDLQIRKIQVEAVVALLDEGNTVPFITRYRKERTGGLDEDMIRRVFKTVLNVDLPIPFPRLTYSEAMQRYGSDKPDLRNPLELVEVADLMREVDLGRSEWSGEYHHQCDGDGAHFDQPWVKCHGASGAFFKAYAAYQLLYGLTAANPRLSGGRVVRGCSRSLVVTRFRPTGP